VSSFSSSSSTSKSTTGSTESQYLKNLFQVNSLPFFSKSKILRTAINDSFQRLSISENENDHLLNGFISKDKSFHQRQALGSPLAKRISKEQWLQFFQQNDLSTILSSNLSFSSATSSASASAINNGIGSVVNFSVPSVPATEEGNVGVDTIEEASRKRVYCRLSSSSISKENANSSPPTEGQISGAFLVFAQPTNINFEVGKLGVHSTLATKKKELEEEKKKKQEKKQEEELAAKLKQASLKEARKARLALKKKEIPPDNSQEKELIDEKSV
jgi:hypothetical protein